MAGKKQSAGMASSLRKAIGAAARSAFGPGRNLLAILSLAIILAVITTLAWRRVGPVVRAEADYLLDDSKISLTPTPDWIDSDVKSAALARAQWQWPVSILDNDLSAKLAQVISLHPWIESVDHVSKRFPAQVAVSVTYRRPVAMVRVADDYLRPIDVGSVVLPHDDFTPAEAQTYPLIEGIGSLPLGVGTAWGDPQVVGAAQLASLLADRWHHLNLRAIEVSRGYDINGGKYLTLLTHGGTRVVWGRPPGRESAEEPPSNAKLARLLEIVREHGPLDTGDHRRELSLISTASLSQR